MAGPDYESGPYRGYAHPARHELSIFTVGEALKLTHEYRVENVSRTSARALVEMLTRWLTDTEEQE